MDVDYPVPESYWSQAPRELLAALKSFSVRLSSGEARERLGNFGPIQLQEQKRTTGLSLFLNQFKSSIILTLLFATRVAAILGDWVDSLIILIIVVDSAVAVAKETADLVLLKQDNDKFSKIALQSMLAMIN